MEEYVGLPVPDFCYPAVEADLEVVELPSGMWTYKKGDGTLATAHYRDSAGALHAGLREELKLLIVFKFRFQWADKSSNGGQDGEQNNLKS